MISKTLYILSGLLTAIIIGLLYLNPSYDNAYLQNIILKQTDDGEAFAMQNAKLIGSNSDGEPYVIKAALAQHPKSNTNLSKSLPDIQFTDIEALLQNAITVKAQSGYYDSGINSLLASNTVSVTDKKGLNVKTEQFLVDLNNMTGESNDTVYLDSPGANVTAPKVEVLKSGRTIRFTGQTTGRINDRR